MVTVRLAVRWRYSKTHWRVRLDPVHDSGSSLTCLAD